MTVRSSGDPLGKCRVRWGGRASWLFWRFALVAWAVVVTVTSSSHAESELLIIVAADHPSRALTVDELRPLFAVTKRNWPSGAKANPVNLPPRSESRREFDRVVLDMNPDEVSRYWIDRKIRGDGRPPRSLPSPPAVVAVVASIGGAVGYVPAGTPTDRVKIVARIRDGKLMAP